MCNILTEKIKIKYISDPIFIKNKVKNYSYAFRLCYKKIDKLKDKDFLDKIKQRFNLNEHELRSLLIDVDSFFKRNLVIKQNKEKQILEIDAKLKELSKNKKTRKNTRRKFNLNKKKQYLENHLSDDIVFGSRKLLTEISFLSNDKIKNKNSLNKKREEYKNNRLLPFFIVGEQYHNGNRNYDLSNLSNNKIILKYNKVKIEIELHSYHNKSKILKDLEYAAKNNVLPITISLSNEYVFLSYDLKKLKNTNINEKERKQECKLIKNNPLISDEEKSSLIKEVYKKYYRELENRIIKNNNKIRNRVVSVDLNPENIGLSVLEYDINYKNGFKILHSTNYDLNELNKKLKLATTHKKQLNQNNKRKYEIIHIWKQIFRITNHYKCSFFIHEDLNFKPKIEKGSSTEGNKKINNLWYREITENTIKKNCNNYGLIEKEVNPCYTSFIGNLSYNYVDAVNSSIEIGRRFFYKEIKQEYYPKFDTGTILNTMQSLNSDGDVSFIKDCETWIMCYKHIKSLNGENHKFRWRRSLKDVKNGFNELSVITRKTRVKKQEFHNNANIFL